MPIELLQNSGESYHDYVTFSRPGFNQADDAINLLDFNDFKSLSRAA